jgi:two-component system chemotaxis response regulator CheB
MVSSYSDKKTVFTALELGAADFIPKPSQRASSDLLRIQDDLLEKVKGIRDLKMDNLGLYRDLVRQGLSTTPVKDEPSRRKARFQDIDVVAIGASTGGPAAIQVILTSLPADFPAGILISQHMPKGFTGPFAERLNRLSMIRVKEATEEAAVEGGTALICPGDCHMMLKGKNRDVRVVLKSSVAGDAYTPSVDIMMTSVAERFGATTMGVVLTGMGKDGKKGVVEIKGKGGYTIAESEKTSVVFGMPHEAIKTGAVDRVLPLDEIPAEITRVVMSKEDTTWKKTRG